MSLLSIVQDAAVRCGVKRKPMDVSYAIGSPDDVVQQLIAFSADVATECMERSDWRNLTMEGQISGDGGTTQWPLPVDYQRMKREAAHPYGALFSYSQPSQIIDGPVSDGWLLNARTSGVTPSFPVWRLIGGAIEIWPALSLNEVVVFNYVSKNWAMNAAGSKRRPTWEADDDISLINEDTIKLGVVWRWKRSKGLDYAEEFRSFEESLARNSAQDTPSRVVSMSRKASFDSEAIWPKTITL